MTLDEFLAGNWNGIERAYVAETGFKSLYVRKRIRMMDVENAHNQRFAEHLERTGWTRDAHYPLDIYRFGER